ncbi:MAG: hypothetical protein PHU12_02930 [Candidatus Aenigmarchaeota archaeon]|nr:hypothetical protein [Candidatus Aenigmarchaeota archaeon]
MIQRQEHANKGFEVDPLFALVISLLAFAAILIVYYKGNIILELLRPLYSVVLRTP